MDAILNKFVTDHISLNVSRLTITKLFGQASARQYFRAEFESPTQSYVIMKLPQGFASVAEEITKVDASAPKELPFLNIQHYLQKLEIRVPKVIGIDENLGLVLLEDLGDKNFESLVATADGPFLVMYYQKLMDELIRLQSLSQKHPSKDCIAWHRSFDEDLLNWEFMHFVEYAIEDRLKTKMSDQDLASFKSITQRISNAITQMPQGFVHRDFQSRNVMFHQLQFYLIDFQDALQGPILYDLVALLRDSYINIQPHQLEKLLAYYSSHLPPEHPYATKIGKVTGDFLLIALQRKLKDAGRFQFIHTVKGNSMFLVHLPQTLTYIRETFEKLMQIDLQTQQISHTDISNLFAIITKYINFDKEGLKAS